MLRLGNLFSLSSFLDFALVLDLILADSDFMDKVLFATCGHVISLPTSYSEEVGYQLIHEIEGSCSYLRLTFRVSSSVYLNLWQMFDARLCINIGGRTRSE